MLVRDIYEDARKDRSAFVRRHNALDLLRHMGELLERQKDVLVGGDFGKCREILGNKSSKRQRGGIAQDSGIFVIDRNMNSCIGKFLDDIEEKRSWQYASSLLLDKGRKLAADGKSQIGCF